MFDNVQIQITYNRNYYQIVVQSLHDQLIYNQTFFFKYSTMELITNIISIIPVSGYSKSTIALNPILLIIIPVIAQIATLNFVLRT